MDSNELIAIWMSLAKEDHRAAKTLLSGGHYSWACYLCSQAAEKCLKAMMLAAGVNPGYKHSLVTMLHALVKTGVPKDEAEVLRDNAKLLTKMALTTRYPMADVSPLDIFDQDDAQQAIEASHKILSFAAHHLGVEFKDNDVDLAENRKKKPSSRNNEDFEP